MGKLNWTVAADVTRLDLTEDGAEWIEVKTELSWGEQKRLATAGLRKMDQQQQVDIDWVAFDTQKILTWVVDWSARDRNNKPLPLTEDGVRALHPDAAELILAKIDEHAESLGNAVGPETAEMASASSETTAQLTPLHPR